MTKTILWSIVACLLLCPVMPQTWADVVPLTLLSTNDIHSHLSPGPDGRGGLARIAAYNKEVRSKERHVLILNAGDIACGTAVSSLFKGDPIFHVLNSMGTDAAVLGNHEFDYGWQRIKHFREIAAFPLLCANAYVEDKGTTCLVADDRVRIFQYGELKVAVIGVLTEKTPAMTTKFATEGVTFLPMIRTLEALVPEVSPLCDIVVALTHAGGRQDELIAREIDGIDLIVGGHSHSVFEQAVEINGVPIIQAGENGYFVGRVDMTVDTDRDCIVDFSYSLIEIDASMKDDPETARVVDEWESKVEKLVDRPLAEAMTDLSERDMMYIAEAAFLESTGADYAHQNSGGTRGEIAEGVFSYRTIWNIFPFENTLVLAEIQGKDIPEHFYGHEPIDPEKRYKIVTNSYVRDQWERSYPELSSVQWEDTGIAMRDAILRYMEERPQINRVHLVR